MSKATKILPKWVFDCIDAYGNCALPNECFEWDRQELVNYLQKETGEEITIRECSFSTKEENAFRKYEKTVTYLVAEVR